MRSIRLKLQELFDEAGQPSCTDIATIHALVAKRFDFLPQPIECRVEGDEVVIQHPEEPEAKRVEAERLADRAGKHAVAGNYERAIEVLKRVLELATSFKHDRS